MEQQTSQTTKPVTAQKVTPQLASTFVFVAEIHSAKTLSGKEYKYIIDAETKERWNLFNNEKVEVNKAYTFSYEVNGTYKNIKSILACNNVFKQEAAKELASIIDIKRDIFMSLSYAKDLAANGVLDVGQITTKAMEFYNFATSKAYELYNATQNKEEIKK
jgi:hypothetical protein